MFEDNPFQNRQTPSDSSRFNLTSATPPRRTPFAFVGRSSGSDASQVSLRCRDEPRGEPTTRRTRRDTAGTGRISTLPCRKVIAVYATLVSPARRRFAWTDSSDPVIPFPDRIHPYFRRLRRLGCGLRRDYTPDNDISNLPSAVPTVARRHTRGILTTTAR